MTQYLVQHNHEAEECGKAFEPFGRAGPNANFRVVEDSFFCTCPHGQHGSVFIAEADDEAPIRAYLSNIQIGQTTITKVDKLNFKKPG